MSNSVNLALDVTKTGIQNPLIKVRQGDGGFETLRTTVTANGEPMDLQGWTITFMGTTAGNHKIVDGNVTLVEAPNGIFDYTPSKAWGMDIGDFKIAYFKFVKGDGSASSANFRVSVIEAVDLTQEEAQNYISVVDTTIAEINQHLTDSLANVTQSIADANANANTVANNVTALGNRVDDYNDKLAAIQVGGRNYILNSSGFNATGASRPTLIGHLSEVSGDASISYTPESIVIKNKSQSTQYGWYYGLSQNGIVPDKGYLLPGQNYTLSLKVRGSASQVALRWGSTIGVVKSDIKFYNISSTWTKIYVTFPIINGAQDLLIRIMGAVNNQYLNGFNGNESFEFKEVKFELGNIATDWTPAPEDAPSNDAQLVHKTGTETISGDKTFTSPINGKLSGNAATATKWQTARTLALTGDVTGSVSVDGANNVSIATTGAYLVHKSGSETIAGDKTFTDKVSVSGTLDAVQKVYARTIGTTNDLQVVYTRVGNVVTGRFVAKTSGTFALVGNDGYKSTSSYPVNVIALNIDAFFTTDNKFIIKTAGEGNFMFITSDPLPAN